MCHKRKFDIFSCGANSMISMLIIYYAETLCLKLSPRLAPNADGVFMFIRIFTTVFRVNIAWTPFFRLEKFKFRTLLWKWFLECFLLESVLISPWIFPESHWARVSQEARCCFSPNSGNPRGCLKLKFFPRLIATENENKKKCQAAPAKKLSTKICT